MPKAKQTLVSQQLFQAISAAVDAGWSINRISQEAGISRPSLQYWYSGQRASLALETVNALCTFFSMRLTEATIPSSAPEIAEPRRKPKSKASKPKGRRPKRA